MILRTFRKIPGIKDHVSGCRVKPARQWWYHRQTSRFKDEVGADEEEVILQQRSYRVPLRFSPVACRKERIFTNKATALSRNEDGQTHATTTESESSSNTPYSVPTPTSYMLSGKRDTEPQLQTGPICLETRRTDQAEARTLPILPDSQVSSQKLMFLDNWIHEHQERNNHLHPHSFFPPPDEEEGRHRSPLNKSLENKKFSEDKQISPRGSTLFVNGEEARAPSVQNSNPQEIGPRPEIFGTSNHRDIKRHWHMISSIIIGRFEKTSVWRSAVPRSSPEDMH